MENKKTITSTVQGKNRIKKRKSTKNSKATIVKKYEKITKEGKFIEL
ncbi:MAG: hypothetical protein FWD86_03645 [Firmicutes bacterium]|nr:hypothetical protein [Bacillota bacterium]